MQVQRACFCKNENIFRILLSSGADVDAENDAKLSVQILRGRIYGRKKRKQAKQDHLRNLSLKFDLGATKCECNLCG